MEKEGTVTEGASWARLWMTLSARSVRDHREDLIELDRQIGDGDHGENLDRGFTALSKGGVFDGVDTDAEVLKIAAKTLMSTIGGAAGPLYGTAFLRASSKVPVGALTGDTVVEILEAALGGIQTRGKAEVGEKTMVDAWAAAASTARAAAGDGADFADVWAAAARGATEGAESTIPLRATKGRASYLGERSIGHLDPGARSSALILQAAAEAARTEKVSQ